MQQHTAGTHSPTTASLMQRCCCGCNRFILLAQCSLHSFCPEQIKIKKNIYVFRCSSELGVPAVGHHYRCHPASSLARHYRCSDRNMQNMQAKGSDKRERPLKVTSHNKMGCQGFCKQTKYLLELAIVAMDPLH